MDMTPIETVLEWLDGVNKGHVESALTLTAPDVIIVGPRGTARGRDVLREWLARAGATFQTRKAYANGSSVVVAQHGVWRDPETGVIRGEADVATRFRVSDGAVAEIQRYEDVTIALRDADLTESDGIDQPPRG